MEDFLEALGEEIQDVDEGKSGSIDYSPRHTEVTW